MNIFNSYLGGQMPEPGSPDWLKMITQASSVPPDQAQVAQAPQVPLAPMDAPSGPQDRQELQHAVPSLATLQSPVAENYRPGAGITAYLPPATRAMDRSIMDQYKQQTHDSMNQQRMGIDQLEQYRNDFAKKPLNIDYSALGALVDSMNGTFGQKTNFEKAALDNRGMTQDDKDDKLLKLQEYIQQAKGNISKENLSALQQQLQMIHHNDQTNLVAQHYANLDKALNDKNDISRLRLDNTQITAAERQFLMDPINKQYVPRLDGAIKIMDLIDGVHAQGPQGIKSNKALLNQLNAEIARLELGSQTIAQSGQEKTEMHDAAANAKDYIDTLTGGVTGVDLDRKFQQARAMIGNLARSYQEQIASRNKIIKAGSTPAQQQVFDAKTGQYEQGLSERIGRLSDESKAAMGGGAVHDMVWVTNGKQRAHIQKSDLQDAMADGFTLEK